MTDEPHSDDLRPDDWAHRVEAAEKRARAAVVEARYQRDRAAITAEEVAALRGDLDAAQRITAHALDELERARDELRTRDVADRAAGPPPRRPVRALGRLRRTLGRLRRTLGRVRRGVGRRPPGA